MGEKTSQNACASRVCLEFVVDNEICAHLCVLLGCRGWWWQVPPTRPIVVVIVEVEGGLGGRWHVHGR